MGACLFVGFQTQEEMADLYETGKWHIPWSEEFVPHHWPKAELQVQALLSRTPKYRPTADEMITYFNTFL